MVNGGNLHRKVEEIVEWMGGLVRFSSLRQRLNFAL